MKGLKKLWNENRVMLVLGMIVIVCIIIISIIVVQYFFGVNTSNYGNRLDNLQDVPITDDVKKAIEDGFPAENTLKCSVDVRGKIIYVIVTFNDQVSLTDAQTKSVDVYNALDEKYRNVYDFNITILQDKTETVAGYSLMGSKNVSAEHFKWSNNTPIEAGE